MTNPITTLNDMYKSAPDQVAALENNINQIKAQIDDLQAKDDALVQQICEPDSTALIVYLTDTKIPELETIYDSTGYLSLQIGSNYNTIDYDTGGITDWSVIDTTADATANVIYSLTVNYDDDTSINVWVADYAFSNDYLTRPLDVNATYGIRPMILQLSVARNLLENNKAKVEQSVDVLSRYVE